MKRTLSCLALSICLLPFSTYAHVNAQKALATFRQEIQGIKQGLISGKIKPIKALVLLSAINTRENEVLIAQNEEIIHYHKDHLLKR